MRFFLTDSRLLVGFDSFFLRKNRKFPTVPKTGKKISAVKKQRIPKNFLQTKIKDSLICLQPCRLQRSKQRCFRVERKAQQFQLRLCCPQPCKPL